MMYMNDKNTWNIRENALKMGRDGWILIASAPLLPVALESVADIFCLKVGQGKFQASRYVVVLTFEEKQG